eukprot:3932871-Amphidinium_carterae.1
MQPRMQQKNAALAFEVGLHWQAHRTTQRSLTPRTRRSVHRGCEDRDDRVMALEGEEQLDVLNHNQRQQREGLLRAIAQRTKLRMSAEGNEEMNLPAWTF